MEQPIASLGDPRAPLAVSTLIDAVNRLRRIGCPTGEIELHLHVQQISDVEMSIVAPPSDAAHGARMEIFGVPVFCYGPTFNSHALHRPSGARVDIESRFD